MEDEARQRMAVVDCGTNTFTLHIADVASGRWEGVFRQKRFVRLGEGSFRSGRLAPQRMRRGLDVLSSFGDTVRNYGVQQVRIMGCSALRDASNGKEFVRLAADAGWNMEVLDGQREAEWIHLGVADSMGHLSPLPDSVLTVDIGGGSVEWVHWCEEGILGAWSLDLGVARLTDWIKPSDPLSLQDMDSIRRIADAAMEGPLAGMRERPPVWLVGTSGAFNALKSMEDPTSKWGNSRKADGFSKAELLARCEAMAVMPKAEMLEATGIHPDRVPYMAVACTLIRHFLDRCPSVEQVYRSRHTLAEGVLAHAASVGPEQRMGMEGWSPVLDHG